MIFVDTNVAENFLYEGLLGQNLPVERKRLDLGDVMIQTENLSYIFERKKLGLIYNRVFVTEDGLSKRRE